MPDVSAEILEQAMEPVSTAAAGQSVTDRPIADKIAADQYAAAKNAARNRRRGLRFTKLINPGALSDNGNPPTGFNTL